MTGLEKQRKLVEILNRRTKERGLSWGLQNDNVWTEIAGRIIRLESKNNWNDEPIEIVHIINNDGTEIESFNDEEIRGVAEGYWSKMKDTRETAYRQATGADEAIDDIIAELESDDKPF